MEEIVASLNIRLQQGNIIYFGEFRQPLVYYVRAADPGRRTYILRGDDTFKEEPDLEVMCHDYRIRYLLLEAGASQESGLNSEIKSNLQQCRKITFCGEHRFYVYKQYRGIEVYKYRGAMAEKTKAIRLSSDLLKNSEHMVKEDVATETKSLE